MDPLNAILKFLARLEKVPEITMPSIPWSFSLIHSRLSLGGEPQRAYCGEKLKHLGPQRTAGDSGFTNPLVWNIQPPPPTSHSVCPYSANAGELRQLPACPLFSSSRPLHTTILERQVTFCYMKEIDLPQVGKGLFMLLFYNYNWRKICRKKVLVLQCVPSR